MLTLFRIAPALSAVILAGSCSDSPVSAIDSGPVECNCPLAEPPLAGRITHESTYGGDITVQVGGTSITGAGCQNSGAVLLSGGCKLEDENLSGTGKYILVESYQVVAQQSWQCRWRNENDVAARVNMTLTCLNPAAQ